MSSGRTTIRYLKEEYGLPLERPNAGLDAHRPRTNSKKVPFDVDTKKVSWRNDQDRFLGRHTDSIHSYNRWSPCGSQGQTMPLTVQCSDAKLGHGI